MRQALETKRERLFDDETEKGQSKRVREQERG